MYNFLRTVKFAIKETFCADKIVRILPAMCVAGLEITANFGWLFAMRYTDSSEYKDSIGELVIIAGGITLLGEVAERVFPIIQTIILAPIDSDISNKLILKLAQSRAELLNETSLPSSDIKKIAMPSYDKLSQLTPGLYEQLIPNLFKLIAVPSAVAIVYNPWVGLIGFGASIFIPLGIVNTEELVIKHFTAKKQETYLEVLEIWNDIQECRDTEKIDELNENLKSALKEFGCKARNLRIAEKAVQNIIKIPSSIFYKSSLFFLYVMKGKCLKSLFGLVSMVALIKNITAMLRKGYVNSREVGGELLKVQKSIKDLQQPLFSLEDVDSELDITDDSEMSSGSSSSAYSDSSDFELGKNIKSKASFFKPPVLKAKQRENLDNTDGFLCIVL